jgi:AraC family transcriptional regulator, transcriptional activator of pobA
VVSLQFDFYAVYLKQGKRCSMHYGRNNYDYQDGTLVFIAPGQVIQIKKMDEEDQKDMMKGFGLLFHPDLIRGTSLGNNIKDYHFFSYDVHEALHISEHERNLIIESMQKINIELKSAIDKHSKKLIATSIELLLDYCQRFYDRQFITREHANKSLIQKFDNLLQEYYDTEKINELGQPTVSYCAQNLHLSANYFGDLIKKESGISAKEYILNKTIEIAKDRLYSHDKSVSEVAYELGFKYPQHFTRLFKIKTGHAPSAYRNMN